MSYYYCLVETPKGFLIHEPPEERLRANLWGTAILLSLPAIGGLIAWFDRDFGTLSRWGWLALFFVLQAIVRGLKWQTLEVDTQERVLILRHTRLGRWGVREERLAFDAVGEVTVAPFIHQTSNGPTNARLKIHTRDGRRWATFVFRHVAEAESARHKLLHAMWV